MYIESPLTTYFPIPGTTYELAQFHFHWGSDATKGSEHTVDGKHFQMEVKKKRTLFIKTLKKYEIIKDNENLYL